MAFTLGIASAVAVFGAVWWVSIRKTFRAVG